MKYIKHTSLIFMIMGLLILIPVVTAQNQRIHVVQQGETLSVIAQRYGVTTQALAQINNITNTRYIFSGQRLIIPATGGPVTQPPTATRTHVIQPGEQLRFIATRYGTTWQALAAVNNIANPNWIYAGQVLVIPPIGGPVVVPPPAPSTPPVVSGRYIVQIGDTMYRISSLFGVNIWDIARANGILNLNQIYAGQSLIIPGR